MGASLCKGRAAQSSEVSNLGGLVRGPDELAQVHFSPEIGDRLLEPVLKDESARLEQMRAFAKAG